MAKIGNIIQNLILSNDKLALWLFSRMSSKRWIKIGEKKALSTFQKAAQKIPAYKKFLEDNKVDPREIETFNDFQKIVPITDKRNYISKNKLESLCFPDDIGRILTFFTSSGSDGEVLFWPVPGTKYKIFSNVLKLFYLQLWDIDKHPSLAVFVYGMGNWSPGVNLPFASKLMNLQGKYQLVITTPGTDVKQIIDTIKNIGKYYQQIIFLTFPSYLKIFLEEGEKEGINWKKLNVKFWLGGEKLDYWQREYLSKKVFSDKESFGSIHTMYAASDAGVIGFSSPLTILIEELCQKNQILKKEIFEDSSFPTLVQICPLSHFVEILNDEILITSMIGGVPIIRYNIHDKGRLILYEEMLKILRKHDYDPVKLLKERGYSREKIWQWPFLYIAGRTGNVVSVIGANVYPENIEAALYTSETKEINSFRLKVDTDKEGNTHFYILVEFKKGISPDSERQAKLGKRYHDVFLKKLLELNSDYRKSYEQDKETADPVIKIYNYNRGPFHRISRIKGSS